LQFAYLRNLELDLRQMGAAEVPSSAGCQRQAAGGSSSQRRGRAALDGGSEAIRQGTRDAGSPARSPPRGRRATAAGCQGGGGTGPWPLGATGDADGVTSEVGASSVSLPNRGGFGHRVADGPWAEQ